MRGNGVALDLIDTGKGIDEKMREHIFDAFFSTKPGGSGLGLPTARKIIEAHGGQIAVQSEVGRGTQFTHPAPHHRPAWPRPIPSRPCCRRDDPDEEANHENPKGRKREKEMKNEE